MRGAQCATETGRRARRGERGERGRERGERERERESERAREELQRVKHSHRLPRVNREYPLASSTGLYPVGRKRWHWMCPLGMWGLGCPVLLSDSLAERR